MAKVWILSTSGTIVDLEILLSLQAANEKKPVHIAKALILFLLLIKEFNVLLLLPN